MFYKEEKLERQKEWAFKKSSWWKCSSSIPFCTRTSKHHALHINVHSYCTSIKAMQRRIWWRVFWKEDPRPLQDFFSQRGTVRGRATASIPILVIDLSSDMRENNLPFFCLHTGPETLGETHLMKPGYCGRLHGELQVRWARETHELRKTPWGVPERQTGHCSPIWAVGWDMESHSVRLWIGMVLNMNRIKSWRRMWGGISRCTLWGTSCMTRKQ